MDSAPDRHPRTAQSACRRIHQRHVLERRRRARCRGRELSRRRLHHRATITPDYQFPSVSAIVQHRLGLRNTGAIDISAACAGFVYALDLADALISTGRARNVLVVAGETLTKITDYRDRSMCILFGDGAGAALVTPDDGNGSAILARRVNSDGAAGKHLFMTALKKEIAGIVEPEHLMRQNGRPSTSGSSPTSPRGSMNCWPPRNWRRTKSIGSFRTARTCG